MGPRWNQIGFRFLRFFFLIVGLKIRASWSLNEEGLILLEFSARVDSDPFGAFANWNANDSNPCSWFGVHCVAGKVQTLNLNSHSLEGTLGPEIGKLVHLRSLVLYKNHFSGAIPKEIGGLTNLELLDLRDNNLSGTIPAEIGKLGSLKCLLLYYNNFEGSIPLEIRKLNQLFELQFDENLASTAPNGISCPNRKLGHWIKIGRDSIHDREDNCCDEPATSSELHIGDFARRRLLEESSNLEAIPPRAGSMSLQIISLPTTRSSGAFPAVPTAKKNQTHAHVPLASPFASPPKDPNILDDSNGKATNQQSPASGTSGNTWIYFLIIPIMVVLFGVVAGMLFICRKQGLTTIGPWKTGLSEQLQKAFVTGVPKLNGSELETACEDFSNIIETLDGCTVYKGTLSSGVEIVVMSTLVASPKDWSRNAEMAYREKIDTLSRINHKNFVNLIGYYEENEPFNRMMVFEYAPNGTLFEHLHVKEMEHLDWNVRMRIIMGTAYCLKYMHHDLNPPVAHSSLNSRTIYLTDDYAAKIAEICFSAQAASRPKKSGDDELEHSALPSLANPETNVYSYGILLLEIISGKLLNSEEQGHLERWAAEYLNDTRSISYMIDPTLKSFKNNELDVICKVIRECIQPDPRHRPSMKDVTSKLREAITISPDQAAPRLSPLWWAELEILSAEAT